MGGSRGLRGRHAARWETALGGILLADEGNKRGGWGHLLIDVVLVDPLVPERQVPLPTVALSDHGGWRYRLVQLDLTPGAMRPRSSCVGEEWKEEEQEQGMFGGPLPPSRVLFPG